MKKSLLLVLLLFTCFIYAQKSPGKYDDLWLKVYEDELNLLPKSALKKVDKIYEIAVNEANKVQKIKSLLYQSKFALTLEENAQLSIVTNFKSEIKRTKDKTEKALLHSMLAHMYWDYFKQHRWRIYNRTETAKKANNDFRTWDIKTLYAQIHHHFKESLQDKEHLKKANYSTYKELIKVNDGSGTETVTLFDFVAYNALDFYRENESSITQPKEPFVVDKKEYLTQIETYPFRTTDSLSTKYKSLQLYQELIQFHKKRNQQEYFKTLLLAVDYIKDNTTIADFDQLKLAFLKEIQQKHKSSVARAFIDFEIAKTYYDFAETYNSSNQKHQYDFLKALEICEELLQKYPEHSLSSKYKALINSIKYKEVSCKIEEYVSVNQQTKALISYRNVNAFYGTIYKLNAKEYEYLKNAKVYRKRDSLINTLTVFKEWTSVLSNQKDYQKHSTEVLVPNVPQGQYLLVGKYNKNQKNNRYSYFQKTNITFLKKENHVFQVLNRQNGSAYNNAKVHLENEDYKRRNYYKINKDFTTDKNGMFEFKNNHYYRNVTAKVTTETDTAYFGNIYMYSRNNYNPSTEIYYKPFVFTDRSIYRPGQKVYFKAIVLKKKGENTEILTDETVEVALYDVNNQEVQRVSLDLNEFGSVASTFNLPISGLNGQYSFKVFRNGQSTSYVATKISVEEYKRPKFETSFKPVKETYKVNDSITVKGEATALSGSKITNAKVEYRVVRKAKFPRWYWWGTPKAPTEIEHGTTTTDANGNYNIVFKAFPDVSLDPKNQPTFYYTVYADVTDINGETRSTETEVAVGYHTLNLELSVKNNMDVCDENEIKIDSENLNGQFVATQGTLKIYKLIAPQTVYRKRPWSKPDIQTFSKEEYAKLFPFESYKEEDQDPNKWEKGVLVFSKDFDTEKEPEISLGKTKNWELGQYIVVAESKDKWGQLVKDEQRVTFYNPKAKKVADNQLFQISLDKDVYQPKDKVVLSVGSSAKNITVFVEVEKDHKTIAIHQIELNNQIKKIKIPVTEKDRGGFAIKWHRVNYNVLDSGVLNVTVPHKPRGLHIETRTFRDLLQPGATQKWSFKIKGTEKENATAEVLASMYDVSLDQFKPHSWSFNPIQLSTYRTSNSINSYANFHTHTLSVSQSGHRGLYHRNRLYVDEFNWFGFSFTNNTYVHRNYLSSIRYKVFELNNINKLHDATLAKDQIKLTIIDANYQPIVGVTVSGSSISKSTLTNFEGEAKLKAKDNDVLNLHYLGYKKATLKINKDYNHYIINLQESNTDLEEVVVVGYGAQKKKEMTGAVSVMSPPSPEKFEKVEDTILVRGTSSFDASNKPLYVVDGVPTEEDPGLAASEIEAIDVLKDVAATAIYGTRGANGVIVVTTKAGAKKLEAQLGAVKARTNFNETAFFFPQLKTDKNGEISFEFTMPEDVTKWKLQLLAHDKELNTGVERLNTVTQKQLMVTPNAPRFLREGDAITFSAKIANLSKEVQQGKVKLELTDAITGKNIDALLQNNPTTKDFAIASQGNTSVVWELQIPENVSAVQYKVVAASNNYSDGEQNVLPVLSNRMLVTETLPLWVNGGETKTFTLEGLKRNISQTLKQHQLTLEITSNPAWYAIQALPYLMEYPHECAEQTFARYYANQLASHIVNSNPKIKKVFEQWENSDALVSNLEKNQELKSIIIQETPWLRSAQSETEQKKRIALLFNLSKMENNLERAIAKLEEMQFYNGGFPWFSGSDRPNRYITQHIVQGFAHLKHLGVSMQNKKIEEMMTKAQAFLDAELLEDYKQLLVYAENIKSKAKTEKEGVLLAQDYLNKKHLYSVQLQYLYIHSFDIQQINNKKLKEAVDYYFHQTTKYWKQESLYNKGLIGLIQYRNNRLKMANSVLSSLEENSITTDEMGMYWKENKASWYWYQSPIETQSLLIEAFSEIGKETKTIDHLKKWLLKNKQTQQWKTTKATSEAVYALLLQGSDWLAIDESVGITIGGKELKANNLKEVKPEAGTGYFKTQWKPAEINKEMGTVTLTKKDKGLAWGGLYWQYFEDLDKIKSATTPLKIDKKVFVKTNTSKGKLLTELGKNTTLKVGDLLTVRIELSTDRDMEFIHMKDMRAAGLEPVDVLSGYKRQDRLGYYQSTKDASTHFFFDKIYKGIYVFEYDLRVSHKGMFSNGITTIQSMYAPEFSSHSKGIKIEVK